MLSTSRTQNWLWIGQEPSLGTFVFHSSKAARVHDAAQGRCIATMFAMRVEEELPVWPEQKRRERLWVSFTSCKAILMPGLLGTVCR